MTAATVSDCGPKEQPMTQASRSEVTDDAMSRRVFVAATVATASTLIRASASAAGAQPHESPPVAQHIEPDPLRPYLTPAGEFRDVSRGNPKPSTLQGDALREARLTTDTWRLEITAETTVDDVVKRPARIAKSFTLADGTALTFDTLLELGRTHGVKFVKAMQCLNIPTPLGQGLWEGVPLREVLKLCGAMQDVRRIAYWGFHNNDPTQMFRSSLSFTQAMEAAPGEMPPFIAYQLNGEPISLDRGGPVRLIVPWAHGFKSIKWLHSLVLTNDYRANDTYALQNNDPESHLKTAAYIDATPKKVTAESQVLFSGVAISGLSGIARVEYALNRVEPTSPPATDESQTVEQGIWRPCELATPPRDWTKVLPAGISPNGILGFDPQTGQPATWPLRYSLITWSVLLPKLVPGQYEFRARAVDKNGFAQPEPRTLLKTGRNDVETRQFEVVGDPG